MKRDRPALALTGLLLTQIAATAAELPSAWQILDNSSAGGGVVNYTTNLSSVSHMAATNSGLYFSVNARFVTNFGGVKTMGMGYGFGSRRFFIYFDLNSNGDLTAEVEGLATYTLTTNGTGRAHYHTHEIVYNATDRTASYIVDGQPMTSIWQGSANSLPAGQVYWGAGSSPGRGQMNFHSVNFEIEGVGLVAKYNPDEGAGPDPEAQGWTLNPASPPANTAVLPILPDTALLPIAVTSPADQITSTGARLNGQVVASGTPTVAWFEWGLNTNYGNATPAQPMGQGLDVSNYSVALSDLIVSANYHFRLVASNTFGVTAGTNQFFNLSFVQTEIIGLQGADFGSIAWCDYDRDGRLDFLRTGTTNGFFAVSQVWRNTGSGFHNVAVPGLPGLVAGSVAWGDYDNDGRPDFLLTGNSVTGRVSQVWRSTVAGFTNVPISGLPGVSQSSAAWGDYDNNGQLDFLITGTTDGLATGAVSQLWGNTGSGFTNVTIPGLPRVTESSVAWADYDNDGRLDFLLTGRSVTGLVSQLWRNSGGGFVNVSIPGLPGVDESSVAWADYDNDGRLDFLIPGRTNDINHGRIAQLWRNTLSGFTNVTSHVTPGMPRVVQGSAAWGDYDSDGRPDLLISGGGPGPRVAELWRNSGNGFTNVPIAGLPGVQVSAVAWGDYDNDGRLDFLVSGRDNFDNRVTQLWRNNLPFSNAPPAAPTALSASVSGKTVTLSWVSPTDDYTPGSGLNYNLRIGITREGGSNVLSPSALTNGLRLLPTLGNVQAATSVSFDLGRLLSGQNCYWSVQAVDGSFAGSAFAPEQQFIIDPLRATLVAIPTAYGTPRWTIQFKGQAEGGVALVYIDTTDDLSGTITAQGQNPNPSEGAPKAFDSLTNTKWLDFATNYPATRSSWIQYQYTNGQAHLVNRYTITSANDARERDPRDWKLLGSNNGGTSWVTLDARTNETFTNRFMTRMFTFDNITAYNIYRFTNETVLNFPASANSVQLAEIQLIGPVQDYSYFWDFGDGATSTAKNPLHIYTTNGSYTVTFTVSDGVSTATNTMILNTADPQFNQGPLIQHPMRLVNGVFQFAFSNVGVRVVEVRATTNLALPVSQWDFLGLPTFLGGGLYQFNDSLAPIHPQRFYLLREQ